MNLHAREIAQWVSDLRLERCRAEEIEQAKDLLLDHLAVLLVGAAEEDSARAAFDYAAAIGGPPAASLLRKSAGPVSAEAAAFAHAAAAHSIEMDDVHNASSLHPGVATIPAALGVAEECGRSGRELLEAILAGYEVVLRVGEAAGPSAVYRRGFHPTAVCGVFSSAAAAGRLMGLTAEQLVHAFGLAWSFASGNMSFQTEGSWAKRLQVGNAARCGVQAARLAALGASGPGRVFESGGFFHGYSGEFHAEKLVGGLGGPLKISEVGVKPYACCRYNQTPIDALLEIRAARGLRHEEIDRIDIEIARAGLPLVALPPEAKRRPSGSVEAQFSLPYSAAVAVVAGAAGRREYREPWLSDPRVLDLAARVHAGSSERVERLFPERWAAHVRIAKKSGEVIERMNEDCLGDPAKPLRRAGIIEKFRSLTAGCLSSAGQQSVIDGVGALESGIDTAALVQRVLAAIL